MTYKELKKIAQPHIRENDVLPSNSFLLLVQLHISFKNEKQCEEDYGGKLNPLYSSPAFLLIKGGEKTIYFNSTSKYWNFYVFHEIAHYLLGHENDSPQNELDADMLACCLAAPVENLPTTLKTARDLSAICQIPIDKAEFYWKEIRHQVSKRNKKSYIVGYIIGTIIFSTILLSNLKSYLPIPNNTGETVNITNSISNIDISYDQESLFCITPSGTHYHIDNCKYVNNKTNIIHITLEEAKTLNLTPCKECINLKAYNFST